MISSISINDKLNRRIIKCDIKTDQKNEKNNIILILTSYLEFKRIYLIIINMFKSCICILQKKNKNSSF